MWKEDLPENCPTSEATNYEGNVFRITQTGSPSIDDFKVYANQYPNNPRYKGLCPAYAISFFDTIDNAKTALKKSIDNERKLGDYIAEYQLTKEDGKSKLNKASGHINTWFYNKAPFDVSKPLSIIKGNED